MRIAAALKRAVSWAAPAVIAGSVAMVVPASWAFSADPGAVKSPVVVELYQSQGCSDCPPAQDFLNRLAGQPGVLALSFGVTYWDYLGWKDSFAAPAFTQRQRDYAARNGDREIATPQYWIDGRTTILGANPARVAQAIGQSHRTGGPAVTLSGNRLTIGQGRADRGGADIWLVRYDPRTIEVPIRAGENGGRTLPHRDIVREMSRVGHWEGAAISIPFGAAADPAWKTAVLLQAGKGGPILAAATS
jgi:hypothetical protein